MVDSSEEPLGPPEDLASFFFTKRSVDGLLRLRITYRGIGVGIAWPEGPVGLADLDRLMDSMPTLMAAAKKEMEVHSAVREMEKEIEDLLGGDCE